MKDETVHQKEKKFVLKNLLANIRIKQEGSAQILILYTIYSEGENREMSAFNVHLYYTLALYSLHYITKHKLRKCFLN